MEGIKTYLTLLFISLFSGLSAGSLTAAERIHIQTDRNLYVSGETMFFSLWFYDEAPAQNGLDGSSIAYILIRDAKSHDVAKLTLKPDNGLFYGSLYLNDTLPTGNYLLTAFTNTIKNSGSAAFFSKWFTVINRFDKIRGAFRIPFNDSKVHNAPEITILSDQKIYRPNDSIYVTVMVPDHFTGDFPNLSMAVRLQEPLNAADSATGAVRNNVSSSAEASKRFIPETTGQVLTGKVIHKTTGQGESGCCVLLSAIDSLVNLKYSFTDDEGNFSFLLSGYYAQKNLVLSLKDNQDQNLLILIDDQFGNIPVTTSTMPLATDEMKQFALHYRDLTHIRKIYDTDDQAETIRIKESAYAGPLIYSKPTYTIKPSDYQPLPDFIEIARELLPSIRIRNHSGKNVIENTVSVVKGLPQTQPDLFLNGVHIDDPGKILSLSSDQISHIEVTDQQLACGKLVFNTVLAVFTIDPVEAASVYGNSSVIYKPEEPVKPSVLKLFTKTESETVPDFRNLLCWKTGIRLQAGKVFRCGFVASQLSGKYEISLEGILDGKKPVRASSAIVVKQPDTE